MDTIKKILSNAGIDLELIKKDFFSSGDNCEESIKNSKDFIIAMCMADKKTIWDVVSEQQKEIDSDKDFTDYQKAMVKASLLLAWEELERDEEQLCLDIYNQSKS